ncbi:MAG: histidine kinase [Clostridia bacterium]|nr:histidine kinase [Clostridia bacterium]
MRYSKYSIHTQLMIMILVVIAILTVLFSAESVFFIKKYEEETYDNANSVLTGAAVYVENEITDITNIAIDILGNTLIADGIGRLNDNVALAEEIEIRRNIINELNKYLNTNKIIYSILMLDTNGKRMLSTIDYTEYSDEQLSDIADKTDKNSFYITSSNIPNNIFVCREITNTKYENCGTVVIRINIGDIIHAYSLPDDTNIIMVRDNSLFYSSLQKKQTDYILNNADSDSNAYNLIKMDKKNYFVTKKFSKNNNYRYMMVMPYDNQVRDINIIRLLILLFLFVGILCALGIGMYITKTITRSMIKLTNEISKVQSGHIYIEPLDESKIDSKNEVHILHKMLCIIVDRIENLLYENYYKQIVLKDAQIKMLYMQINPHFLYNTLTSVYFMLVKHGEKDSAKMVKSLSDLMRRTISEDDWLITIEDEIALTEKYVYIQTIRFSDRLRISIDIPGSIRKCVIPKFTFQPIIENSITHVLENSIGDCEIKISAKEAGDEIIIIIEDNGTQLPDGFIEEWKNGNIKTKNSGIGLRNIDQRIKLAFEENGGIEMEKTDAGGLKVCLRLVKKELKQDVQGIGG